MIVESNYTMAIATLGDWLKTLAPDYQPLRRKTKTNRDLLARFFPHLCILHGIATNFDWLIALSALAVIKEVCK